MRPLAILLAVPALALALPAQATEVEVTRFHTPATLAQAGPQPVTVRAVGDLHPDDLASRVWLDAVSRQLERLGYTVVANAPRVVEVSLRQETLRRDAARSRSGVSVGVGVGSGGGYYGGSGVGLGLGFLLGGKHAGEVRDSELSVTIADAATGQHLWEGRAEASPRASSKDAQPARLADEMAAALFAGFPGESGATIRAR
ncbi:MAG: DUF4136 domain-containing protein [Tsuneonella sp.]